MFLMFFYATNLNANVISQKFEVEVGVFDAATVELNYNEHKGKYNIGANIKTANFFGSIYPFEANYEANGNMVKNKVLANVYKTKTKSRNHIRTKEILYDKKGKAYKRISTKDERINERAIENVPQTADAADLQTVFANLIDNFYKTKDCEMLREVYDGKKHYKVIAKNEGSETKYFDLIKKSQPAYKCSVYIENLKENNDNILWDVTADRPINLWIRIDEKTKMPFVLEIRIDSTPLGALQVTPSTLEIK